MQGTRALFAAVFLVVVAAFGEVLPLVICSSVLPKAGSVIAESQHSLDCNNVAATQGSQRVPCCVAVPPPASSATICLCQCSPHCSSVGANFPPTWGGTAFGVLLIPSAKAGSVIAVTLHSMDSCIAAIQGYRSLTVQLYPPTK